MKQLTIFDYKEEKTTKTKENELFISSQVITYLGNKRSLLDFIANCLMIIKFKFIISKRSIRCIS
jgi:hypothetical protein